MSENLDTTAADGDGIVDADFEDESAKDNSISALFAGFDEKAGEALEVVAQQAPAAVTAMQANLDPDKLPGRVALISIDCDDTPSMKNLLNPTDPFDRYRATLMGIDLLLSTVASKIGDEPVKVLGSVSMLNGGLVFPYTDIAEVPSFGTPGDDNSYDKAIMRWPLHGSTAWFDRYSEKLAATATQIVELESYAKQVYGLVGTFVDGADLSSKLKINELRSMIEGYRKMKSVIPFAIYGGPLPKPGDKDYDYVLQNVNNDMDFMHIPRHSEFRQGDLETMVRGIFLTAGFDPTMIFLPGQDMKALVATFLTLSKLMITLSKAQLPSNLTLPR